ncbi:MAG: OmpA family protein [Candidatus Competibacterales bacterium]
MSRPFSHIGLAVVTLALAGAVSAQDRFWGDPYNQAVVDPFGDCVIGRGGETFPECVDAVAVIEEPAPAPIPPPAPPVEETPGPFFVSLGSDANFDFDRSDLRAEGQANIRQLVNEMQRPDIQVAAVEIVGHTDSVGTEAYNQALSERRARSAADFMASLGVPSAIIATDGRGELQPIASNATPEGRARNRRVDITVDAQRLR